MVTKEKIFNFFPFSCHKSNFITFILVEHVDQTGILRRNAVGCRGMSGKRRMEAEIRRDSGMVTWFYDMSMRALFWLSSP